MRRHLMLFGFGLLLVLSATAAGEKKEFGDDDEKDLSGRKRPNWFNRPAEKGAAAQFDLAGRLAKAGKLRAAGRAYNALVRTWPFAPQASKAQQALADLFEERRRPARAFEEYQYLVDNYAGHFAFQDVLERQFRIANAVMSARRAKSRYFRGFASPERALPMFEKLAANAPEWKQAAETQYRLGLLYLQTRDFDSALVAFEKFRFAYADSPLAEEADYRHAESLYQVARHAPRDETALRDGLSGFAAFLRDRPSSGHGDEVRKWLADLKERLGQMYYERACFYDKMRRQKPKAALIAYEEYLAKFPTSDRADRARQRVAALRAAVEAREKK